MAKLSLTAAARALAFATLVVCALLGSHKAAAQEISATIAGRVLTADGLEVTIDLTVLYKVLPSDAPKIVRETGLDYTAPDNIISFIKNRALPGCNTLGIFIKSNLYQLVFRVKIG